MYSDRKIALDAVKNVGVSLAELSHELRADKEIVLEALNNDVSQLVYASDELRADKEFLLEAIKIDCAALDYASIELQADKEIVFAALRNRSAFYRDDTNELWTDKELAIEAVKNNDFYLILASDELRADREFILEAVKIDSGAFDYASDDLQADKEFVLAALRNSNAVFEHVTDELWANKEFVLEAIKIDDAALLNASKELQADSEFVLTALRSSNAAFEDVIDDLWNDKEFVSKAVKINCAALEYASDELRTGIEVVLGTVKNDGATLNSIIGQQSMSEKDFILVDDSAKLNKDPNSGSALDLQNLSQADLPLLKLDEEELVGGIQSRFEKMTVLGKDKDKKKGWCYILINDAFPDLVKIGFTDRDPRERMKELYSTGVPSPFELAYAVLIQGAGDFEGLVHRKMGRLRHSKRREFFNCSVTDAIIEIKEAASNFSIDILREDDLLKNKFEAEKKITEQQENKASRTRYLESIDQISTRCRSELIEKQEGILIAPFGLLTKIVILILGIPCLLSGGVILVIIIKVNLLIGIISLFLPLIIYSFTIHVIFMKKRRSSPEFKKLKNQLNTITHLQNSTANRIKSDSSSSGQSVFEEFKNRLESLKT